MSWENKMENQKGWICPKCNTALSPVQKYCPLCTKPVKENTNTEEKQILLETK